jgi:hypothetical protein
MMVGLAGPAPEGLRERLLARGHTVFPIARDLGRLPGVDLVLLFGNDADYAALVRARAADLDRPPRIFEARLSGSRGGAAGPSVAVPGG